jgi:hypothetical protein
MNLGQSFKAITASAALLLLASCDQIKQQNEGECQAEGMRTFTGGDEDTRNKQIGEYVAACMRSKGFMFDESLYACAIHVDDYKEQEQPSCYRSTWEGGKQ